jgi:hypothetical protein
MDAADLISDEELELEALAADPDMAVGDDAVAFVVEPANTTELLPSWYMPPPQHVRRTRLKTVAAVSFIVALLAINAGGLCITYGFPSIA